MPTCLDVLRRKIKFFIELKRALRIVYDDHNSSHSELRMTKNKRNIHQQNINVLMKLKVWKRSISPLNWSVWSLQSKLYPKAFPKNNLYQKSSVKVDLGTIFHCAPQLWNFCLTDIKDTPSLSIFKEKLKPWHCNKCPCRLCKTHYYFMFCVTYILQNLVYNIYLLNDILLL